MTPTNTQTESTMSEENGTPPAPLGVRVGQRLNTLSSRQMFQVATTLTADRDRILKDRPSKAEVAEALTTRLGFQITEANVVNAAKAAGLKWNAKRDFTGTKGKLKARVVALEAQVAFLFDHLNLAYAQKITTEGS